MKSSCFIGVDLGTSGIKVVLTDAGGRLLAQESRPTELLRPEPGRVEFSSERCYALLCEAVRGLVKQAPAGTRVAGLALSGATGNTLLMDEDGNPLHNAISWMDSRTENDPECDPPGISAAEIYQTVGWPWFRGFPLAHLAWLRKNEPVLWKRKAMAAMNITYLYHRLTGKWAMDHSTATTFYFQDQKKRKWHKPFLEWLGLNERQLPELLPSGRCMGAVSGKAAKETGLPEGCAVVLGSFDHPSAARGAGVMAPGDLLLSLGTSWVGFYPVMKRETALDLNMLIDPFLSSDNGPWGALFSLPKAGERLNGALLSAYADRSEAERYALFEQDLRMSLNARQTDNAAIRLVFGLISTMHEKTERFAQHGFKVDRLILAGGPSNNRAIVDLFGTAFGKPVQRAASASHAGALGAALLAREGRAL